MSLRNLISRSKETARLTRSYLSTVVIHPDMPPSRGALVLHTFLRSKYLFGITLLHDTKELKTKDETIQNNLFQTSLKVKRSPSRAQLQQLRRLYQIAQLHVFIQNAHPQAHPEPEKTGPKQEGVTAQHSIRVLSSDSTLLFHSLRREALRNPLFHRALQQRIFQTWNSTAPDPRQHLHKTLHWPPMVRQKRCFLSLLTSQCLKGHHRRLTLRYFLHWFPLRHPPRPKQ